MSAFSDNPYAGLDYKIVQICAAAPGWKAVFEFKDGDRRCRDVAFWAHVQYQNGTSVVVGFGENMISAEHDPHFITYFGPSDDGWE